MKTKYSYAVGFGLLLCLILTSTVPLLPPGPLGASEENPDKRIVARVNGEPITKEKLSERARIYRIFMALRSVPLFAEFLMETKEGESSLNKYRRYVLDKLIREKIIRQKAGSLGVNVREEEITERLEIIIQKTEEVDNRKELMERLKKDRRTLDDLKEEIHNKLLREKLREEVLGNVSISEGEISDYYDENRDSFRDKDGEIRALSEVKDHIREKLRTDRKDLLWRKWLKEAIKTADVEISMNDRSQT